MVALLRIELRTCGYESYVLPLNYRAIFYYFKLNGAGRRIRTDILSLEDLHTSPYTIPAYGAATSI